MVGKKLSPITKLPMEELLINCQWMLDYYKLSDCAGSKHWNTRFYSIHFHVSPGFKCILYQSSQLLVSYQKEAGNEAGFRNVFSDFIVVTKVFCLHWISIVIGGCSLLFPSLPYQKNKCQLLSFHDCWLLRTAGKNYIER